MSTDNYIVMAVRPWEQKCPGHEGGRALIQPGWGPWRCLGGRESMEEVSLEQR